MLFLQDSKSHENVLSSLMMTLIASDDLKDDVFSVDTTNVFLWLFFLLFFHDQTARCFLHANVEEYSHCLNELIMSRTSNGFDSIIKSKPNDMKAHYCSNIRRSLRKKKI